MLILAWILEGAGIVLLRLVERMKSMLNYYAIEIEWIVVVQ
tara:strand:+ start:25739 stop:25861 length:123 start_codon:yes stop_codon:yes gene_type:complete